MSDVDTALDLAERVSKMAKAAGKHSGFSIGNTAKSNCEAAYFTPIRNTTAMVHGGVIVYSESQAVKIAQAVDGRVDYILVDAEKKIPAENPQLDDPANVERSVRETIHRSTLWIYKGNDLSVDAIDALLTQLTRKRVRGIGGANITILGAGNLGSKLALKLVERGANVIITRRNRARLTTIVKAINYIKPQYTVSQVVGKTGNASAAKNAEILIGTTQGLPVITAEIVGNLAENALIVDVGKGTLYPDAFLLAESKGIDIYRLDISSALEGLIAALFATEQNVDRKQGRRILHNESLVSGGLLGRENEFVVDNVWQPEVVFGAADGMGDFVRDLSGEQMARLEKLRNSIEQSSRLGNDSLS